MQCVYHRESYEIMKMDIISQCKNGCKYKFNDVMIPPPLPPNIVKGKKSCENQANIDKLLLWNISK